MSSSGDILIPVLPFAEVSTTATPMTTSMRNWSSFEAGTHFFHTTNNGIKQKPSAFVETPVETHKRHLARKLRKNHRLFCILNFKFSGKSPPRSSTSSRTCASVGSELGKGAWAPDSQVCVFCIPAPPGSSAPAP